MTTYLPDRLELRQRMFLLSRTQRWALWAMGLMTLAAFAAVLIVVVYLMPSNERNGAALLNALLVKLVRNPVDALINILFLIVIVLQLVYLRLAQQRERLILTRTGIEYRSPLPGILQALRPSWSLTWGQIRSTALQGTRRARVARGVALELDNGLRKVKLFPFLWVDPARYQPISPWAEVRKLGKASAEEIVAQVEDSAVLRYIAAAAPQLIPQHGASSADVGFALEKNSRALAVVIVFFVFFLYALGDTFIFGHEIYADQAPYRFFIAAGILAAVAAALWMRRAQVPVAESLGVALLFGAALGAAAYPCALRVNAFTDVDGLRRYDYRLTPELTLRPLVAGLPTLAFPSYADYWSSFRVGSVHTFELRRGGLGFYQLNMLPVEAALREYYEEQNRPGVPRGGSKRWQACSQCDQLFAVL
jgi:hypothetical protein